jgi:hypothetical protein
MLSRVRRLCHCSTNVRRDEEESTRDEERDEDYARPPTVTLRAWLLPRLAVLLIPAMSQARFWRRMPDISGVEHAQHRHASAWAPPSSDRRIAIGAVSAEPFVRASRARRSGRLPRTFDDRSTNHDALRGASMTAETIRVEDGRRGLPPRPEVSPPRLKDLPVHDLADVTGHAHRAPRPFQCCRHGRFPRVSARLAPDRWP